MIGWPYSGADPVHRLPNNKLAAVLTCGVILLAGWPAALACSPQNLMPPQFCSGKSDGTAIDLQGDTLGDLPQVGVERIVGQCRKDMYGMPGIGGPGTVYLGDAEKFIRGWDQSRNILPDATKRIAGDFVFGGNDGLLLRGPVFAYGPDGRLLLKANYDSNGTPIGPFSLWTNDGSIRTDGALVQHHDGSKLAEGLQGRIVSRYEDDQVAAVQFYCFGMPIGRHWHFDRAGKLTRVEDFTASDYQRPREHVREILAPPSLAPTLWQTSCGGHPFYDVLWGTITKRTVHFDGRGDELAIADDRHMDFIADRFTTWHVLPQGSSLEAWFQPGATVRADGMADVANATLSVRPDRRYLPLRDDIGRIPRTETNAEMVKACGEWLEDAFSEVPLKLH